MGLFDALLSQEGVNLTGGGFVGAPDDKLMETRFDDMGNAYQVDVRMPLHQGHTKANSFNIPDNAQGLLQPEMPTESIDLGRQQVVQPSPQMMQPVPQSSFMPGSQESMAQNQQSTISPWSPEQTDYTDARNVMSGYKGGERLAQRDSGTFQDLTPNADPSQAMEMLAMFKKEGKALTDLQFEKAMGSLGMSDVLAENRSTLNTVNKNYQDSVYGNTDDFGNPLNTDDFGNAHYDQRVDNYANNRNDMSGINDVERVANVAPQTTSHSWLEQNQDITQQSQDFVRNVGSNIVDGATDLYDSTMKAEHALRGGIKGVYDTVNKVGNDFYKKYINSPLEERVQGADFQETLGVAGENISEDTARQMQALNQVVDHPVDFFKTLIDLASGATREYAVGGLLEQGLDSLDKKFPALAEFTKKTDAFLGFRTEEESREMATAMWEDIKEDYGSWEGYKEHVAQEPTQALLEVVGGGFLLRGVRNKLNDPALLDKVESMSKAIDPTNLGPSSNVVLHHGSKSKFEKFDHDKMGSGEGAQAWGWGTYLAEHPDVAGGYQKRLSGNDKLDKLTANGEPIPFSIKGDTSEAAFIVLLKNEGDVQKALKELNDRATNSPIKGIRDKSAKERDFLEDYATNNDLQFDKQGSFYDVDVPDEIVDTMIDWDVPLDQQPNILKRLEGVQLDESAVIGKTKYMIKEFNAGRYSQVRARDILEALGKGDYESKLAAKELEKLGVGGVKFLDQDSRNSNYMLSTPDETTAGDWMVKDNRKPNSFGKHFDNEADAQKFLDEKSNKTRNFVIFNEDNMKIIKRDGEDINVDDGVLGQTPKETAPKPNNAKVAIPAGGLLGEDAINVEAEEEEPVKDGILNNVKSWKPNNKLSQFVKMMENDPLRVGNTKVTEYDDVGHKAKGYGTKAGLLAQDTEAEASKALNSQLVKANKAVDRLVKIDLNEDQRNALVSLVYNVGATGFGKSNALKALNNGNIKTFLKEAFDPKIGFVKTKGKIVKGLVNRRAREKSIFTKGNYGN